MGNKNSKKPEPLDVTNTVFCPLDRMAATESLTIPSRCEAPSFTLSAAGSQKSDSSNSFKWSKMMSLILEHKQLTEENLSPSMLRMVALVMEALKRNLRLACEDIQSGYIAMPDQIADKFKSFVGVIDTPFIFQPQTSSNPNLTPLMKKILVHLVAVVYFHDIILTDFRNDKSHSALELLKQIAVSHALKGVSPLEFRLMDWFLVHYLMKNQIVNDEGINTFVSYLNTLSNQIAKFYEEQSVRGVMLEEMTTNKPENDRKNKCRENYRIMKKWNQQIEAYKEHESYVEQLLSETTADPALRRKEESIDTLTLKERDCIMKHFVKKRKMQVEDTESHEQSSQRSQFNIT